MSIPSRTQRRIVNSPQLLGILCQITIRYIPDDMGFRIYTIRVVTVKAFFLWYANYHNHGGTEIRSVYHTVETDTLNTGITFVSILEAYNQEAVLFALDL